MHKRTSKEIKTEIINLYRQGLSPKQIGDKFGLHNGSIVRILRKSGEERNQCIRVSPDKVKTLIDMYVAGTSSEVIAKVLNISSSAVRRNLRRNNIQIRPSEENKRIYTINQDFFENIDTEEKAYFLGFLYTDGYLSKTGKQSITLSLHPQDIHILEKISNIIYGFKKITISKPNAEGRVYAAVYIYSKKMYQDLIKLGCTNKKSFTIIFPTFLREDLVRHFIRGYFDGDGCISIANPKRPVVDITSTLEFIEGMIKYVENVIDLKFEKIGSKKDRTTNTRNVQLHGFTKVKQFLDYLYKDATIYLKRKKDKYDQLPQLLSTHQNTKMNKNLDTTKYGTTLIPEFEGIILTGKNIKQMDEAQISRATEFLFNYYREGGFPYVVLTDDEIIKDFSVLKKVNIDSIQAEGNILKLYNQAGIPTFKHFSPHYYEVKSYNSKRPSFLETFNNDILLKKVIKNRLDQYFNMTGNMLKQGLPNSKVAFKASIFFPVVAKFIYSKYIKENDVIYDYSMGFGQRLLAALSLPYNVKYIGVDPLKQSVESNNNIYNFINGRVPMLNKNIDIRCCGSEEFCDEQYLGKVNLAFSSPPYFNLEHYSNDNTQAYHNNSYSDFINVWWRKTVSNIDKLLTADGIFALNIKNEVHKFNLCEDMSNIIKEYGFSLIDTFNMQLTRNTKFAHRQGEHKFEPILIFKRK